MLNVIITGGTSGIGQEIATRIGSRGDVRVIVLSRTKGFWCDDSDWVECDVKDQERVNYVMSMLSSLDNSILINCAGICTDTVEDINTNLSGNINVIDSYLKHNKRGRVIQLASIDGINQVNIPVYAASKAGIIHYIECCRKLHPEAKFTTINAGYVYTSMTEVLAESTEMLDVSDVASLVEYVIDLPDHVVIPTVSICPSYE